MIVIGLDAHKHALTAVAVDELGRSLAERTNPVAAEPLLAWARSLDRERLWALEDCRHVTRTLERSLAAAGERLVRVPPRLNGATASARAQAGQVGRDRRARGRPCCAAGTTPRPPTSRRGAAARAEAAP
jgi:transposase